MGDTDPMTAIMNLTKHLQKTLQYRLHNPTPPPPATAYDPLPTLLMPVGSGCYEAKQCTAPCNYHPGGFDKGARVNAVLAVLQRISLKSPSASIAAATLWPKPSGVSPTTCTRYVTMGSVNLKIAISFT